LNDCQEGAAYRVGFSARNRDEDALHEINEILERKKREILPVA
jgi:hypothetical protein